MSDTPTEPETPEAPEPEAPEPTGEEDVDAQGNPLEAEG
jgi:hypothetical protein